MRVMGIDPGLTRCGLGVVDVDASRRASLVYVGVARTDKDLATHFRLRTTGLLGAPEDSSVAVSISGRLTARGSMTPAQRAWAEAQAAQRRTGAVDPRRRRG